MYVRHNNNLYGPKVTSKGLMQGACLSPNLYNLLTSLTLKYIHTDVKILQFADDILLYHSNINTNVINKTLNDSLEQLHNYYSNFLKLNINSDKSSCLIVGENKSHIKVFYKSEIIPIVKEKKFLGVILDDKLHFQSHINYISKNALKGINVLRSLTGTFWGSDPKILSLLYKSIVRSRFDYSSMAYINAKPNLLKKLDIIQNIALRIILGAMGSTPINAMEVESCIEPLTIRRLGTATKHCIKVLTIKNSIAAATLHLPQELCSTCQILKFHLQMLFMARFLKYVQ